MRRILYAALFFTSTIGVALVSHSSVSTHRTSELELAIVNLRVGMSETDVRSTMNAFIIDSGKIYWGGTGSTRLYLELPGKRQLWIELGGFAEDFKVLEVGRMEAKQPWTRYHGDSIGVELVPTSAGLQSPDGPLTRPGS